MRSVCLLGVLVATLGFAGVALAAPLSVEVPQRSAPVDFERELLPILRANCLACHNSQKAEAKLVLESPQAILRGSEEGAVVVAGKGDESLLLKVAAQREESFMPPADNQVGAKPLTPQQLGLLKLWIDQGATGTVSLSREVRWQGAPKGFRPILATAVTPDGQYAVCSRANELSVYHLPSNKLVTQLVDPELSGVAHQDLVRSLAFDPRGERLASGGFREIKLWRRPLLTMLAPLASESPLSCVAVTPDGQSAATGDESGSLRILNVATQQAKQAIDAHAAAITALAVSPDGSIVYSVGLDKALKVWQTADGKQVGKALELASPPQALTMSGSGQWLAVGSDDGMLQVWDVKTITSDGERKPLREIKAHTGAVAALTSIDKPSESLISAGKDGLVRRWSIATGEQEREYALGSPITALAASSPGQQLAAAGGGRIKVWKIADGAQAYEVVADPRLAARLTESDAQLAFAKAAVQYAQQDIKSYEGTERRVMTTAQDIKKAEEEFAKAQKTRDEKKAELEKNKDDEKKREAAQKNLDEAETAVLVAQTVIDRAKVIADKAKQAFEDAKQDLAAREAVVKQREDAKQQAQGAQKSAMPGLRTVTFSSDGAQLYIGGDDGALHAFAAETGQPLQSLPGDGSAARAPACGKDWLVSVGGKQTRFCRAPTAWQLERKIAGSTVGAPVDRVLSLDFSPDGQTLASSGGLPGKTAELKLWKVADGTLVRDWSTTHTDTIFGVRFSPDGERLATASADRSARIFQVASGEQQHQMAGHTAHVLGVAWHASGKQLITCGADQMLKQWDAQQGTPLRTLKGTSYQIGLYRREVAAVSFIGATELYVAACGDGTVRLHRTTSEGDVHTFKGSQGYQYSVAATPDGRAVVVGGADGVLRMWTTFEQGLKQSWP